MKLVFYNLLMYLLIVTLVYVLIYSKTDFFVKTLLSFITACCVANTFEKLAKTHDELHKRLKEKHERKL